MQTLVPIMLDHVHKGSLSLERFVDLVCYGPQRVHQIAGKGRIAKGYDADFTIADLKKNGDYERAAADALRLDPYDGMKVTGWPILTLIHGQVVMCEDELIQTAGRPVRFRETLTFAG